MRSTWVSRTSSREHRHRSRALSRTCSGPISTSSSAASTRAGCPRRPAAHFANPRNDFWRLLHAAGFTSRLPTGRAVRAARATASASRTRRRARRRARATSAAATSPARPSGSSGSRASSGRGRSLSSARRPTGARSASAPELGLQERSARRRRLFVLPSTSPANAAVPYAERMRWFRALARLARAGRPRRGARARRRSRTTASARHASSDSGQVWWATARRGIETGEDVEAGAAARARRGAGPRRLRARPEHLDARRTPSLACGRRAAAAGADLPRRVPRHRASSRRSTSPPSSSRTIAGGRSTSSTTPGAARAAPPSGALRELARATARRAEPFDVGDLAAPAVRDRQAPVAAERLRAQLHAGRRLPALVLGPVDHRERAVDDLGIEPVAGQLLARRSSSTYASSTRSSSEYGGSESSSSWFVAQLGARGPLDDRLRDQLAPARSFRYRASRNTSVLNTSLSSAKPPAMSP